MSIKINLLTNRANVRQFYNCDAIGHRRDQQTGTNWSKDWDYFFQ